MLANVAIAANAFQLAVVIWLASVGAVGKFPILPAATLAAVKSSQLTFLQRAIPFIATLAAGVKTRLAAAAAHEVRHDKQTDVWLSNIPHDSRSAGP
jgi:hypothetical protein